MQEERTTKTPAWIRFGSCALVTLALAACGDDDPPASESDTDVGVTTDTAADVVPDVQPDVTPDVQPDATGEPPTVALDGPAEGTCVDQSVELSAIAADDDAIANVTFFAGETEIGVVDQDPYSIEWDASQAEEGSVTLRAVATDSDGMEASAETAVIVDHTAPDLTIASPGSDTDPPGFRDTLPVSLTIEDAGGVVEVTITLSSDDVTLDPVTLTEAPWEAELDITDQYGEWTLMVEATDCVGLTTTATASVLLTTEACDSDGDFALSSECGGNDCDDGDETFISNVCGGCEVVEHELDAPCGTCETGTWACGEEGAFFCDGDAGDAGLNPCGGCVELLDFPGDHCHECDAEVDECEIVCTGPDTVVCMLVEVPEGFVHIEPGTFVMGSPDGELGRRPDEDAHEVTLTHGFFMQAHEVTQAEWISFAGNNPAYFPGCDECPMETINFYEALAYANSLSEADGHEPCYELVDCVGDPGTGMDCTEFNILAESPYECDGFRLPTEAEWEYAARAGTTSATYIGELEETGCSAPDLDTIAWSCANTEETQPVGTLEPNAWGLYDMLGNVFELTTDWHAEYPEGPVTDPVGPESGTFLVIRGGAWDFAPEHSRASRRAREDLTSAGDHVGFRLVLSAHAH